jgi:cell division GTPase FtsZ
MRLVVIGLGDCGSRLAGEFIELNRKAKSERKVQIITNAYAINNDEAVLDSIKSGHRELNTVYIKRSIEGGEVLADTGADIMRVEGGRVLSSIRPGDFYETDAVLLIAGCAGVFGSGGLPMLVQQLRERHVGKPIYTLMVLPFETETEKPECIYNTAITLKTTYNVADTVFLFDNEKLKTRMTSSSQDELNIINKEIVSHYYDMLCTSEELDPKYAGARTVGIGDMLQTLSGWTVLGLGRTEFPTSRLFQRAAQTFQEKSSETQKAMEAMGVAFGHLSIDLKLDDSSKALYLLSIPAKGANVDMANNLGNRLREVTNNADIRGGEFYGAKDCAQVTVVLSGIHYIETIKRYYDRAIDATKSLKGQKKKST